MESGLTKAFMGVYNSSKAIIKNSQRHLYCNMLDLLARTTKTTGQTYLNKDDFMLFCVTDIMPLIFDHDAEIQKNAIAAMETIAVATNFITLYNTVQWNEIKSNIVQNYSKEINRYREGSNSCWYKIWCILIRILDKEIIKGASTINTFLSIVELGFRSSDYNVRAEAFYCWKVLIEIFAKNNEIYSQKRIRLICIPLKSSHSKTTQASAIKLKVWWYLITALHGHIEHYIDVILEPFLTFCCASKNKNGSYLSDFKEMTILCLISFLGKTTKLVKKRMEYFEIEVPLEPSMNKNIMAKSWKLMINYVIEAIDDCSSINVTGIEYSELLLRYMMINVLSAENTDYLSLFLEKLNTCNNKDVVHNIQKFVCNHDLSSYVSLVQCDSFLGKFLSDIIKLIISKNVKITFDTIEELVKCIFNLNQNRQKTVFEKFIHETQNIKTECLGTIIETWKCVSAGMIKSLRYLKKNLCDSNFNDINNWLLWPLKKCAESNKKTENIFDERFNCLLGTVFDSLCSVIDKSIFLNEASILLTKIYSLNKANYYDTRAYFSCFVKVFIGTQHHFSSEEKLVSKTFDILKINLSQEYRTDDFELCAKCLKYLVSHLNENDIEKHFGDIKDVWSHIVNHKRNNYIDQINYEMHRRQFLENVKKVGSKAQYNKIRNYLENDDLFVIIPAVWSLNPEKLTERQKEKFFEKSDIPALYNDMSQSQDTFIKPWTPSKIVIAKGHVDEIVIGNEKVNENDKISTPIIVNISPKNNSFRNISESGSYKNSSTEDSAKNKHENIIAIQNESTSTTKALKTKTLASESEEVPSNSNLDDYTDAIILKDTSSPPDRKQTNNSTSPLVKPKTTHLTGRGAQLINMIRNKKHENYPNTKQMENTSTPISKGEGSREKLDSFLNTSNENDLRPSPMNLLVFSKTLPSPCASPSVSILKRKLGNDSMEDVFDSQPFKRKRVSFHDPPVSVTKEYLKDEENKANSKRCLLMDQELKATTKHLLRRSAKIDNQAQIDNLSDISGLTETPVKRFKSDLVNSEESTLKFRNETDSALLLKSAVPLVFKSDVDILSYVMNRYPIEEVCEKYLCGDKTDKIENDLIKLTSKHMNSSHKFKTKILEMLSEEHPKEILDYAVQENLATVVCDRLNSNTIIDYVCNKSQTNISCRTRLLQELQDILNHDKFANEKWEFIQKALLSKNMSDQQLLNIIDMLFESKRKHQRAVSESAIDSSSTL